MNAFTIGVDEFCEFKDGRLRFVDFSKLYTSRPPASALHHATTLLKTGGKPMGGGIFGLRLWGSNGQTRALVRMGDRGPVGSQRRARHVDRAVPREHVLKLHALPKITFPVHKTKTTVFSRGWDHRSKSQRIEVEIPYGLPRYVSAATLKTLLGAGSLDILFRQVDEQWEICPNSHEIDLQDRTRIFKLGEVEIGS